MSDNSDFDEDYPGFNLSQLTAEDFAKIDADVTRKYAGTMALSKLPEKDDAEDALSDTDTIPHEDEDVKLLSDASFCSDGFSLNLGQLTAEELALLDGPPPSVPHTPAAAGKPTIEIELEDHQKRAISLPTSKRWHDKSPLERFRSYISLSVTDLVGPSWCEVQYDYGLRGKRSRPVKDRPKSFVSASGKTIVPTVNVAKKNENITNQGLKVHKELEREIKFEELKVDITTPETRWALRLVNMIACLRGILDGFTREMPVFGILHDEIVVGIMDEVVKIETVDSKRSSSEPHDQPSAKKAKVDKPPTGQLAIDKFFDSPTRKKESTAKGDISTNDPDHPRPSWQVSVDRFFDKDGKASKPASSEASPSRPRWNIPVDRFFGEPASEGPQPTPSRVGYTLQIKDNKTRRSKYMPSEPDMYSGRIQLMIYRRLLSQLVATNPPYDFKPLWKKLHLDSSQVFPTKFLVQAQLIQESSSMEFPVTCLDDLVDSWHKLVKESNILGVSPDLELVYRLRPSEENKGKEKAESTVEQNLVDVDDQEAQDLAKAVEENLEASRLPGVGPSTVRVQHHTNLELVSENDQLQWALQQSMLPQAEGTSESSEPAAVPIKATPSTPPPQKPKGKAPGNAIESETGIRRYDIIGTHTFAHNDAELDRHLAHVLKWWRGERKPAGVSLEHSYRCSTCEYINDCEWRAAKALELKVKKPRPD